MKFEEKIISIEEFNKMKSIFDSKIKTKIGDAYSAYLRISLEDLKNYISMIEKQASENQVKVQDIKFHFVSKNDETGQLTLVLEGTFDNADIKASLMNKFILCPPNCGEGGN